MSYPFYIRSSKQTTMKCPQCGKPMLAERSCLSARLHCEGCGATYPVEQFIAQADDALEQFLDGLYVDRI